MPAQEASNNTNYNEFLFFCLIYKKKWIIFIARTQFSHVHPNLYLCSSPYNFMIFSTFSMTLPGLMMVKVTTEEHKTIQ